MAIVGGGVAASATAIGLSRHGVDSLILEKGDDSGDKIGETLPPEAQPVLAALGLVLGADHIRSYGTRSVWGSDTPLERDFITSPYGHGWHLDRRLFEAQLADRALAAGVTRVVGVNVRSVSGSAGNWRLIADGGRQVTAEFLVDATGRASWLARRCGAVRRRHDPLVGVVTFLASGDTPDPAASTLVEAVENGWWYSATLPGGRLATAHFADPRLLDRGAVRDRDAWIELARRATHTWDRIERHHYRRAGAALVADASGSVLERVVGQGWLAVGDAAVAYDPLSSYGITSAMVGGLAAAEAIVNPNHLAGYEADVQQGFSTYKAMRSGYYAAERRWPASAFWQARWAASEIPSTTTY